MDHSNKTASIAATLVVGLVVGLGGGYAIGHHNKSTTKSSDTTMSAVSADTDGATVGGAKMVASKDIVQNALNAKNVTTVVSLVKQADLVSTLESAGPLTVFGPPPTNGRLAIPIPTMSSSLESEKSVHSMRLRFEPFASVNVFVSQTLREEFPTRICHGAYVTVNPHLSGPRSRILWLTQSSEH